MNMVKIIFGTNSIPQKGIFSPFPSTLFPYTHPRLLYDSLLHLPCPSHQGLCPDFTYFPCNTYTSCVSNPHHYTHMQREEQDSTVESNHTYPQWHKFPCTCRKHPEECRRETTVKQCKRPSGLGFEDGFLGKGSMRGRTLFPHGSIS